MTPLLFSLSLPQRQDIPSIMKLAIKAETLGYHGIWLGDHYFNRNIFTGLGMITKITQNILLGTGVTNPFHITPAMLASAGATLQELSGNRFRMGIGTGDTQSLLAEGITRPRGLPTFMKEVVEGIKNLAKGEEALFFSHKEGNGKVAKLNYAGAETSFPIYLGVLGSKMMNVAIQCCEGMLVNSSNKQDIKRAEKLLKQSSDKGLTVNNFQIIPFTLVEVVKRNKEASNILKGMITKIVSDLPMNYLQNLDGIDQSIKAIKYLVNKQKYPEAANKIDQDLIERFSIIGSIEDITERLLDYQRIKGVNEVVIGGPGIPGNFEGFINEMQKYLPFHRYEN
ncbi:MAG: LLM class flavin-dependent oxidoreductase [Candidatus Hodarchaeales archaeon]